MELFVVRHAIAFERDPSRWPDDGERPLTPQGEVRFRRAARGIGRVAGTVEVVLSSPLVRAWRTAEILAEEAGWPGPVELDALGPERPAKELADALAAHRLRGSVAVVGHEPLLGELIAFLLTGAPDGGQFPLKKGGAASLDVEGVDASLRWFLTPKIERALRS